MECRLLNVEWNLDHLLSTEGLLQVGCVFYQREVDNSQLHTTKQDFLDCTKFLGAIRETL